MPEPIGRRLLLGAAAVLAPFYFVFPGSLWEDATPADRRFIRIGMVAGWILYLLVLAILLGGADF